MKNPDSSGWADSGTFISSTRLLGKSYNFALYLIAANEAVE